MPEQDNWKEIVDLIYNLRKGSMDDNQFKATVEMNIQSLLSSQAHALKEKMKACVPEKRMFKSQIKMPEDMNPDRLSDVVWVARHNITDAFNNSECNKCGVPIWITPTTEKMLIRSGKTFYCHNGHGQNYLKNEPPKEVVKIKEVEVIKEIETFVELPYQPKDFTEMLKMHEHNFSKKHKGEVCCSICGIYKTAYETLSTSS